MSVIEVDNNADAYIIFGTENNAWNVMYIITEVEETWGKFWTYKNEILYF